MASRKRAKGDSAATPQPKPFDPAKTVEFYASFARTMRGRFDPAAFAEDMLVTEIVATSAIEGIQLDRDAVHNEIRRQKALQALRAQPIVEGSGDEEPSSGKD